MSLLDESYGFNYILKIINLCGKWVVDLHFSRAFPLDGETCFIWFGENLIFRKRLGVTTYFYFIFEGKNKIRNKNPKCDLKEK